MIKWLSNRRFFSVVLFLLIAIQIFALSSIKGIGPSPVSIIDLTIVYHFCAFFLLNFFLLISLNGNKKIEAKYIVIAFIFSIIYSILDEIHQMFVPFRYADVKDLMVDGIGIVISTVIYMYSKKSRKNQS